jgi:hypothetical protein
VLERFPDAKVVATPGVAAAMRAGVIYRVHDGLIQDVVLLM